MQYPWPFITISVILLLLFPIIINYQRHHQQYPIQHFLLWTSVQCLVHANDILAMDRNTTAAMRRTGTHRPILQVNYDGVGGEVEALAGDVHFPTFVRLWCHSTVCVRHWALWPCPESLPATRPTSVSVEPGVNLLTACTARSMTTLLNSTVWWTSQPCNMVQHWERV